MEAFNIRQHIDDINQMVYDLINDSSLAVHYGNKMLKDCKQIIKTGRGRFILPVFIADRSYFNYCNYSL